MFDKEKCDLCGDCLFLCPYVDYDRDEAVEQFRRLLEGETPPIVSRCITCVACNQFCEKGANPFDLILARQEETGVLNIPEENTLLFRNLPDAPTQVIPGEPGKPALSLCSVGDLVPGLFDGPLFEGMTVLKGGDFFCGVGWVHLGQESPVRDNAPRVVEKLAATGAEEIVFYHDDCYSLLASMVKDYGIDVPFHPVHIIEYLLNHVKERTAHVQPLGLRVAYQQPCASRYTPWKDTQLDELFGLIGVDRAERQYDRLFALCCGSPVMPRDRERALEIKERNIKDAVAHQSQAMAYLCPLCILNLRKVATEAGMENYHLIELVERALSR
ncbi:MAG: (Fe-S)-binding protein [Actinobacteria bacterium]|nr:(Fe-S)-binding protein [Actinomycetota bacterium]